MRASVQDEQTSSALWAWLPDKVRNILDKGFGKGGGGGDNDIRPDIP